MKTFHNLKKTIAEVVEGDILTDKEYGEIFRVAKRTLCNYTTCDIYEQCSTILEIVGVNCNSSGSACPCRRETGESFWMEIADYVKTNNI